MKLFKVTVRKEGIDSAFSSEKNLYASDVELLGVVTVE